MKKGFTMIELIFVIVILGILASVAIPRLAGTRTDAEVATTVANLRTIVSEVSSYYVAHGNFNNVNWKDLTNVPLGSAATTPATTAANLKVGETANCITVQAVAKSATTKAPAHIQFGTNTAAGVCAEVLAAEPVQTLLNSQVNYKDASNSNTAATIQNAIAIGSTTSVY